MRDVVKLAEPTGTVGAVVQSLSCIPQKLGRIFCACAGEVTRRPPNARATARNNTAGTRNGEREGDTSMENSREMDSGGLDTPGSLRL